MKQTEVKTQEQLYAGEGLTAADLGDTLTTAERMRQFDRGPAIIGAPQTSLPCLGAILASAISDQLVDYDIEGHGQATCWLNDREIRLEFRYDSDPGDYYQPATHNLEITGASYGPMDNWASVKLTREQEQAAQAELLPMYVKWLAARQDEPEDAV